MQTSNDMQRGLAANRSSSNLFERANSYLGPGLQIKGEITGNEDLTLDSNVEGLVSIGGFRLTVGPNAKLQADITAREALIFGEVAGDISARDRIEIMKSASVKGDLSTGKIKIEEGAYFSGDLVVDSHNQQIGTDLDSLLKSAKKHEGQQS